jgi:hypothetical protein
MSGDAAETQTEKVKSYLGRAFTELADLVERGADIREIHASLLECASGLEQLLEISRDPNEPAPLALSMPPKPEDLYGPDTPEPVREWRHAVFMCTIAARALAPLELGKLIEKGTRAETVGPLLDPTLYQEKGRRLREDIQLFAGALSFVSVVKLEHGSEDLVLAEIDSTEERQPS